MLFKMALRDTQRHTADEVQRFIFHIPGDREATMNTCFGFKETTCLFTKTWIAAILIILMILCYQLQVGVVVGVAVYRAVVGEGGEGAEVVKIDQNNHKRIILVQRDDRRDCKQSLACLVCKTYF